MAAVLGSPALAEPAVSLAPRPGGIADRARAAIAAPYLNGLNPEQRRAVEAIEGPVLVLAGAGTGKTRVLTTRIAHILATGHARPHDILAVTFTNKAAREMKERIAVLVGSVAEGMPWLGTFHSIGTKILRRHAELVGLKSSFTILDTDDQIRLLKQVLQAENVDDKRWPARGLAHLIDSWKNRGLDPSRVPAGEAGAFANGKGQRLYAAYQERLKILNAADFGDLLLECLRLFREQPDVLAQYQNRFRFMLVDEYQDTNVVQYLWLRLLAQGRHNLCCVGDDDQSIYGWRGAEVDNILRFEHDFPGATVVRLENNYRSTGHILGAASGLIAHNEDRLGKTLFTEGEAGEKPAVAGVWDSEEEARAVGEEIEQLQRQGQSLDDVAILVRASFQMREFEERFITLGLPYRVIGGPRFYERLEIRDALAYLRCVAQPDDDLAFERIVNTPKRGLGDSTLQLLHDVGRKRGLPLMATAQMMVETEELKPKQRQTLRALLADFDRWRSRLGTVPHSELAETVLEESGYTDFWQKDRSADAAGRLENLKELVRSMEEFPDLRELSRTRVAGHGGRQCRRQRARVDHDAARRQGARIRDRVPARLGGGAVSAPALARRQRPRRPRGGAAARLCGPHAGQAPRAHLFRHQPAHSRAVADHHAVAVPRRAARATRRGDGSRPGQAARQLRGLALRPDGKFRLPLCDPGLAAGAAQWRLRDLRHGAPAGRDRGRAAGEIDREGAVFGWRPGAAHQVRPWYRGGGRRQQAHRRFRPGRPQDGAGQLRPARVSGGADQAYQPLMFHGNRWSYVVVNHEMSL